MKKLLKYLLITLVVTFVLGNAVFAGDIDDPYNGPDGVAPKPTITANY